MFSKEGPVLWWNLWLMKVDVLFLSFFTRNDNIFFGWNFVREELREVLNGFIRLLKNTVNPGGFHKLAGYC